MKELSLHILDIAKNSVRAGARLISILMCEENSRLTITIQDDGCGMSPETLEQVQNPFYTTRTTRSVGLGIPLYQMAAEQTGGSVKLRSVQESVSPDRHGTTVTAVFDLSHIDCAPLGDMVSTVCTLIQGAPGIDFVYRHTGPGFTVEMDTRALREVLGADIPLDSFEVMQWIKENLEEQYQNGNPPQ